jgi:pyruvate dehydrogenase E1 component
VLPEVVAAAETLVAEGVAANVIDITSADRLFQAWRQETRQAARRATRPNIERTHLAGLVPITQRSAPIVTVSDSSSHSLAWFAACFGTRTVAVGVDEFGQSGDIADLYRHFGLASEEIVNTALGTL